MLTMKESSDPGSGLVPPQLGVCKVYESMADRSRGTCSRPEVSGALVHGEIVRQQLPALALMFVPQPTRACRVRTQLPRLRPCL